ncbi:MAG: hypothetical protein ABFS86_12695 [Planctomycetota bacterium]
MKTAISLPDELFDRAESLAARLGVSRSRLYANAIRLYLAIRQDETVRDSLDRVYGEDPEGLDETLKRAQAKVLRESEW